MHYIPRSTVSSASARISLFVSINNKQLTHVNCLLFVYGLNAIYFSGQSSLKQPQYEISQKCIQLDQSYCMRANGRTVRHNEATSSFLQKKRSKTVVLTGW
jgi:hypothetical protein